MLQPKDSETSGIVVLRRPPKTMASSGTPLGSSYSGASISTCLIGVQNRELGCAAGRPEAGVQSWPFQSVRWAGTSSVMPSHQTPPSSVRATLVKMVLPAATARIAFGLVDHPVPGATPKSPASGLMT